MQAEDGEVTIEIAPSAFGGGDRHRLEQLPTEMREFPIGIGNSCVHTAEKR